MVDKTNEIESHHEKMGYERIMLSSYKREFTVLKTFYSIQV